MRHLSDNLARLGKYRVIERAFRDDQTFFSVVELSDVTRAGVGLLLHPDTMKHQLTPMLERVGALVIRTREDVAWQLGMAHELSVIDGRSSDVSFKIPHQDLGQCPHLQALFSGPFTPDAPKQADTLLFGFWNAYIALLHELGSLTEKLNSVSSQWAAQWVSPRIGNGSRDQRAEEKITLLQKMLPVIQRFSKADFDREMREQQGLYEFVMLTIPYLLTSFCVDRDDPDILAYLDRFYDRMREEQAMFTFDWNERSAPDEQVMLLWAGHRHFHALGPEQPGRKRERLMRALVDLTC